MITKDIVVVKVAVTSENMKWQTLKDEVDKALLTIPCHEVEILDTSMIHREIIKDENQQEIQWNKEQPSESSDVF